MQNKIIFFFFFYFSQISNVESDSIEISIIVENCKSCHGENYEGNQYIKSLKDLKKIQFVKRMNQYKFSQENSVMVRITKVLSKQDILKIADYIYEKNSKK
tara:strand:- start:175 stop:477 length:303 start_codon:yes stop_codon:yes gene_type:complete